MTSSSIDAAPVIVIGAGIVGMACAEALSRDRLQVVVIERLGLAAEGCRSIDARALGSDRFVIRYLDGEDQQIVAYEFDPGFRYLGETRVHVAEWIGDEPSWTLS